MKHEFKVRYCVVPSDGIDFGVRSVGRYRLLASDGREEKREYFGEKRVTGFLQVYWLAEGSAMFVVDDEEKLLEAGDVLIILPGVEWTHIPPSTGVDFLFWTMDGPATDHVAKTLRLWTDVFHVGPPPEGRFLALSKKVADGRSSDEEHDAAMIGYELLSLVSKKRRREASDPLVEHVQETVHDHWANPDLTLDFIAKQIGIHKSTLCARFKMAVGMTLWQYVTRIRLRRAKELIVNLPDTPIANIAERCGFRHASYFSHVFREHFGVSASEVRRQR